MDNKDQDALNESIKEESSTPTNYTRQLMELQDTLNSRLNNIIEWYGRQVELDKNNDEQLVAIERLQKTEFEYNEKRAKVIKEYMDKVAALVPDRIGDLGYNIIYFKARYIGPVNKYTNIYVGMDYYMHLKDNGSVDVYDDVKYSKFIVNVEYSLNDWQPLFMDII